MKEDSTHITLKIINGNTYFFILTDSIYIYIYRIQNRWIIFRNIF